MSVKPGESNTVEQTAGAVIADEIFRDIVNERSQKLLGLAGRLSRSGSLELKLTRPILGDLLSQATQLEELLDAYGAANNRWWCGLRSATATIKLFSDLDYELLHIRHALPSYRLLPIEQDFAEATEQAIGFAGEVLRRACNRILAEAEELHLTAPDNGPATSEYDEHLPPGRLPRDRDSRTVENVPEIVAHLATAFLSLAAESKSVHVAGRARPEEYASCFPDPVSEDRLRYLQHRFHNLQSLYDTHVSDTQTECLDADLPVLRGHISVVFHLLKTATALAHHYERHVKADPGRRGRCGQHVVAGEELLKVLMSYSIAFSSRYLLCGIQLCQSMLDRYAEMGRIEVPLPHYRGFHVRPSTLISKIVTHYGSDVRMELEGEKYDAGSPLEIFRANEKINAGKRRWLASEIARLNLVPERADGSFASLVRQVVLTLAEQGKTVIYEQALQPRREPAAKEGNLHEQVIDEIARLQAISKIDIRADLNVVFVGDKRVLADIRLLAESGYGEDSAGNNVALPEELSYLRR